MATELTNTVSSSDFQNAAGEYFDRAAKGPVIITKYRKPARVLLDIDEYERLKQLDTREHLFAWELSDRDVAAIAGAQYEEDGPPIK